MSYWMIGYIAVKLFILMVYLVLCIMSWYAWKYKRDIDKQLYAVVRLKRNYRFLVMFVLGEGAMAFVLYMAGAFHLPCN